MYHICTIFQRREREHASKSRNEIDSEIDSAVYVRAKNMIGERGVILSLSHFFESFVATRLVDFRFILYILIKIILIIVLAKRAVRAHSRATIRVMP